MSYLFDDASSEALEVAATPISDYPFTLSAWFRQDADVLSSVFGLGSDGNVAQVLRALDSGTLSGVCQALSWDGGGSNAAQSASAWTVNTWHHVCGVYVSDTSRFCYLDGAAGSEDTNSENFGTHTVVSVGRVRLGTPTNYFSGHIADCALWDVALGATDITNLAAGAAARTVSNANLQAYWPLVTDNLVDEVGGLTLSKINSPSFDSGQHPPVNYGAGFLRRRRRRLILTGYHRS